MDDSIDCPHCGESDGWSVLATTQTGVKLPGDSDAALDRETRHELQICADCGICYDPTVASEN